MDRVVYEKRDRIAFVTLNRPEALNSLDDALRLETINGYSSPGDFKDTQERLASFFTNK